LKQKRSLFLKFLLFSVAFITIGRFCDKQTKGFTLSNIVFEPPAGEASSPPSLQVSALLDQPYRFLGRGGQSFAFVSEDGKTVIKFFKQRNIQLWQWASELPLPAGLEPLRKRILKKNIHHSPLFFESCRIAEREFKDRTGLLYLHLGRTESFKKKLTIVDNLGIAHQIDLDRTRFAVQQKAEPSYKTIKKLIKQKDLQTARRCIDSIVDLAVLRHEKGISDRDPNIRRNIGFIGEQAVEIDLGSYAKASKRQTLEGELARMHKFHRWLDSCNGELAAYFAEKLKDLGENPSPCPRACPSNKAPPTK